MQKEIAFTIRAQELLVAICQPEFEEVLAMPQVLEAGGICEVVMAGSGCAGAGALGGAVQDSRELPHVAAWQGDFCAAHC